MQHTLWGKMPPRGNVPLLRRLKHLDENPQARSLPSPGRAAPRLGSYVIQRHTRSPLRVYRMTARRRREQRDKIQAAHIRTNTETQVTAQSIHPTRQTALSRAKVKTQQENEILSSRAQSVVSAEDHRIGSCPRSEVNHASGERDGQSPHGSWGCPCPPGVDR